MFDLFLPDDIKGSDSLSASTSDVSSLGAPTSSPGGSRYVLFGERPATPSQDGRSKKKAGARTSGSTGGDGSPSLSSPPSSGKRWTRVPKPSSSDHHLPRSQTTGSPSLSIDDRRSIGSESATTMEGRPIIAATMERWIVDLTSRIDAGGLVDFFLTYRNVIKPLDLCRLLISRFEWALTPVVRPSSVRRSEDGEEPDPEAEAEARTKATKRIVRVRTFVVIRHWLLNHFEDDFLPSRELRSCLTAWLNAIAKDPRVVSAREEARIVKSLKKVVKQRKETFLGYNLVGRSNATAAEGAKEAADSGKEALREIKSASTLRGRGLTVPPASEGVSIPSSARGSSS